MSMIKELQELLQGIEKPLKYSLYDKGLMNTEIEAEQETQEYYATNWKGDVIIRTRSYTKQTNVYITINNKYKLKGIKKHSEDIEPALKHISTTGTIPDGWGLTKDRV